MNQSFDLLKDDVKSLYFKYLFPSICATLVTSIYVLADTIIIGKGIGAQAVAALNLVLPLFNLLFGTGLLFGVGGCILLSIHRANGDTKTANAYFTTALYATIFMIILYLALGIYFFDEIALALGSTNETIHYVREYGRFLLMGIPFFLLSSLLQAFIRNDKAPKLCMVAVISGGVLNILLDILFVFGFHWGMKGAAFATVLGSVTTCSLLVSHFFTPKNTLKLNRKDTSFHFLFHIFRNGISSFLIEMSGGIVTFFFNLQLLKYMGVLGITVYSIISNTAIVVMSLSNGISQSAQPIISMNYGARQFERIRKVKHLGIMVALIVGSIFALLGLLIPEVIVNIFVHPTNEILQVAPTAIRIYFLSFIGCTLNMFSSNYFQAMVRPIEALIICLLRGVVLSVFFVYLLPVIFGAMGIWYVMPLSEAFTLIIAMFLIRKKTN